MQTKRNAEGARRSRATERSCIALRKFHPNSHATMSDHSRLRDALGGNFVSRRILIDVRLEALPQLWETVRPTQEEAAAGGPFVCQCWASKPLPPCARRKPPVPAQSLRLRRWYVLVTRRSPRKPSGRSGTKRDLGSVCSHVLETATVRVGQREVDDVVVAERRWEQELLPSTRQARATRSSPPWTTRSLPPDDPTQYQAVPSTIQGR